MMMPKKTYHKLRGRMFEYGITQEEIAEHLGRSKSYVSKRFNCNQQFELSDVYNICGMLDINEKEIHIYFHKKEVMKCLKT